MSSTNRNHGIDANHNDITRIDNCDNDDLFTRPAATAHIDATIIAQRPDSAFIPATATATAAFPLLPLLIFALILLVFASPAAASFTPLWVAHACRQNCEAQYQVCAMAAGVSAPRLASCMSVRAVCLMHC
ncbi:hypothetical protein JCM24511_01148 [Saitozyma sp. JCM 24511]|nr:hypothetical protein JCM24511_01148 [Saitozyma sp. JCM 24511]